MWSHCPAVSVGMRSKIARISCDGEAMLFSSAVVPAGFVDFQLQAQPLAHGIEGDGVDVVRRLQPVQRGECLARGGRELLVPGGGEVLVFGLVPGQAEFGGEARVKPDQGVREGVGDGVDGGLRARGGSVV